MADQRETTEMVDDDQTTELAESDKERYEIAEAVEDAIAGGVDSPFMRSEYYYAYQKGGKIVAGLTSSMYAHLALVEGISIDPEKTTFTEEDGWLSCDVEVFSIENPLLRSQGYGCRPTTGQNGTEKRFIKQTVQTIAFRNAVKKLLPFDLVTSAVDKFMLAEKGTIPGDAKHQQALPKDSTPRKQQPAKPAPQTAEEAAQVRCDNARKRAFAVATEHQESLDSIGISKEVFWQGVRDFYEVDSRADMTEQQWKNLASSLEHVNNQTGELYAAWIQALAPEPEPETEAETEESEDDPIPF